MYVKKRLGVIGAEIDGLDLEKNDDAMYAQIDSLLMEHQVLFFRDQDISHESHKRMATRFGVVKPHPAYQTVEDFPEITKNSKMLPLIENLSIVITNNFEFFEENEMQDIIKSDNKNESIEIE